MAILIRSNGHLEVVGPSAETFSLRELQSLVGGYIEIVKTVDERLMVIDEEGKLKGKPINTVATSLYLYGHRDRVVGEAVILTREEMEHDEEED